MVPQLMDDRVADVMNDFVFCPAETQDRASIDSYTGRQFTSRLKKGRLVDRDSLIETQQIVF